MAPGERGTKNLHAQYGRRFVCARYRRSAERQRTITTVEIVVDDRPWTPKPERIHPNQHLPVQVDYHEIDLRKAVKAAGGSWDATNKVWRLAYKQIVALGLTARIVTEDETPETT